MWKAALVMLIAFVGFVATTLTWGSTLDGRSDPCVRQGVDLCDTAPERPTTTTTTTTPPTTAAPTSLP